MLDSQTNYACHIRISKKNPCLVPAGQKNEWGFTLVRKIPPTNKEKSSNFDPRWDKLKKLKK